MSHVFSDIESGLNGEIDQLRSVLRRLVARWPGMAYCCADWLRHGRHSPDCVLQEARRIIVGIRETSPSSDAGGPPDPARDAG